MSKAALQASNTSIQNVVVDSQINVGSINLRFGRDVCVNNGSVVIKTCGYYKIDQTVTVAPTEIGTVAVKMQHNGVDIPGAISYGYASAADQNVTLNLSSIIRVVCNNGCPCEDIPDTVSLILVSGAGAVSPVLTDVVKL